jgi:hypothetical protein
MGYNWKEKEKGQVMWSHTLREVPSSWETLLSLKKESDAFTKGKRKSSKYPSVDEWTNKRWDRHHGIVLSLKKER